MKLATTTQSHYHPYSIRYNLHHHYTIITMNTKPSPPLPPQYHQYHFHHNPYVKAKLSYITPTTITITTISKILTTTTKFYRRVVCGGFLVIVVFNDVVMGMGVLQGEGLLFCIVSALVRCMQCHGARW